MGWSRAIRYWVMIFSILGMPLYGVERLITSDVQPIIHKLLEAHLVYHQVDLVLLQKVVAQYLYHFDPHGIYLMQGEITSLLQVSQSDLVEFEKGHYAYFQSIDGVIQKAIWRARLWDNQPTTVEESTQSHILWPTTLLGLRQRRNAFLTKTSVQSRRELREHEEDYLPNAYTEHQQSLHLLQAFTSALDPHSEFFSENDAAFLRQRLQRSYPGVGLDLQKSQGGCWRVEKVVPASPADQTGAIEQGDLLVAVNQQPIATGTAQELTRLHRLGEPVELTFIRGEVAHKVILTPNLLPLQERGVRWNRYRLPNGRLVGYLALDSFYYSESAAGVVSSSNDIQAAWWALKSQGPVDVLILDLRQNGGGFLQQAIDLAGLFLGPRLIGVTKCSDGTTDFLRSNHKKSLFEGPLLLLTSKASASATELFLQAIRDYHRGWTVGDHTTFGKGTIQDQTIVNGQNGAFYRLTVGRYYGPKGESAQLQGVPVDIIVPGPLDALNMGERFLAGALPTPTTLPHATFLPLNHHNHGWFDQVPTWYGLLPRCIQASHERVEAEFGPRPYEEHTAKELIHFQLAEALKIADDIIRWLEVKPLKDAIPSLKRQPGDASLSRDPLNKISAYWAGKKP